LPTSAPLLLTQLRGLSFLEPNKESKGLISLEIGAATACRAINLS
jgi:hypothetical protein